MADLSEILLNTTVTDSAPAPSTSSGFGNGTASDAADNVSAEIGEEVEDAVMFGFFGIM